MTFPLVDVFWLVSLVEAKQPRRCPPEQPLLIVAVRKQSAEDGKQGPVIDPLGRPQEWPVRSPDTAIEGEGLDQGGDERPCIAVRIGLLRELVVSRQLDDGIACPAESEQRLERGLLQSLRDAG